MFNPVLSSIAANIFDNCTETLLGIIPKEFLFYKGPILSIDQLIMTKVITRALTMSDSKYLDIAIEELKNRIELLDRHISDSVNSTNNVVQQRNEYIATVEVLERIKEEKIRENRQEEENIKEVKLESNERLY